MASLWAEDIDYPRCQDFKKLSNGGRQVLFLTNDNTVTAVRKKALERHFAHILASGKADISNDRYTQSEFNIFLDHFPAPSVQRDRIVDIMLSKYGIDDAPGGKMSRWKNQTVRADVFKP